MDPMTLVAAAVAAGVVAGATDTAKQVVVDAYQAVRGLISRRYQSVELEVGGVEKDPQQPMRRQLLAAELAKVGAGDDEELLAAARQLLAVIAEQAPRAAESVGVKLIRVEAGREIYVTDVVSSGSGVVATDTSAGGSIRISGIRAGVQEPPDPSGARR